MKKEENAMLLFVDCCISYRGDRSRSHALCQAFLEEYKRTHPAEDIETVNLQRMALKPFDQFTTDDRNSLRNVKAFDSPVASWRQFKRSGPHRHQRAPQNLTFSHTAGVHQYICVRELTYHYENQVCVGDCMTELALSQRQRRPGDRGEPGCGLLAPADPALRHQGVLPRGRLRPGL